MWQLESEATNASSGSTALGLEKGTGTTDGDDEAGTVTPPSKVHVCSREYLPLRKSGEVRVHLMVALYSDIKFRASYPPPMAESYFITSGSCHAWPLSASKSSAAIGPHVPAA